MSAVLPGPSRRGAWRARYGESVLAIVLVCDSQAREVREFPRRHCERRRRGVAHDRKGVGSPEAALGLACRPALVPVF
jgi:hypothetical protein